jgi:hypothetical protein
LLPNKLNIDWRKSVAFSACFKELAELAIAPVANTVKILAATTFVNNFILFIVLMVIFITIAKLLY